MNKAEYNEYLASREWSLKREAVRVRCNGTCERCGANEMHAVHHLTYERKGNEALTDLQGVCEGCHEFIHAKSTYDPLSDVLDPPAPFDFDAQKIKPPPAMKPVKAKKIIRRTVRHITVMQPDIDNGVPGDPRRCTLVLAAWRTFPEAKDIVIRSGQMEIWFETEYWEYKIPRSAACIPILIDKGHPEEVVSLEFRVHRPNIYQIQPKKKRSRAPVIDREKNARARAGALGAAKRAIQQSAAKKMLVAVRRLENDNEGLSRFQGIGV
jgi:hypothetical protein